MAGNKDVAIHSEKNHIQVWMKMLLRKQIGKKKEYISNTQSKTPKI